jgi:hypothetical protein
MTTEEDTVRCCGSTCQEITVNARPGLVAMQRCTACGNSQWARDGRPVPRDEAFAILAAAFQDTPVHARARRAAAADRSAARQALRTAAAASRASRPAPHHVVDLLSGWTVLGAAS